MTHNHGSSSKYERNSQYVRDRRIRSERNNPIGGARREAGPTAAYRLISLVCAIILIATGVYLAVAIVSATGFRSHWRVVIISQFAQTVFDVLQSEQVNWQSA